MSTPTIIFGIVGILLAGMVIYQIANKLDQTEGGQQKAKGKPSITPRLEFNKDTGELHYVIENSGTGPATDVEIYLPDCQNIALSRNRTHSKEISAAIGYVTLQRHRLVQTGQSIETPIMGLPPTQDSVKSVIGLGLQVTIRWRANNHKMKTEHKVLPVFIRKRSNIYG